jgi:hypothetical protein
VRKREVVPSKLSRSQKNKPKKTVDAVYADFESEIEKAKWLEKAVQQQCAGCHRGNGKAHDYLMQSIILRLLPCVERARFCA